MRQGSKPQGGTGAEIRTGQGLGRGQPLPEVVRPGLSGSPQYSVLREHGTRALHHGLLGDYFSNNKSKESVLNNSVFTGSSRQPERENVPHFPDCLHNPSSYPGPPVSRDNRVRVTEEAGTQEGCV